MYQSPSPLPLESRTTIIDALNACLADGIDLQSQLKVAHWNIKGPLFAQLHPLLDSFASGIAARNDEIAERAVTLGGRALGTARHVATASRLVDYPQEATRDLEHVRLLADRYDKYLAGLRQARGIAERLSDVDTEDLLTQAIRETEKDTWFLRATLDT